MLHSKKCLFDSPAEVDCARICAFSALLVLALAGLHHVAYHRRCSQSHLAYEQHSQALNCTAVPELYDCAILLISLQILHPGQLSCIFLQGEADLLPSVP